MVDGSLLCVSACGARWIELADVFCALDKGHAFEHRSKVRIEYENGVTGSAEIIWISDANLRRAHDLLEAVHA